ncbi:MAG: sulfurtransferase TusA family protein [Desulfamplus sp.]|nr:sulfurtransferase TusA family protein [Desulfamplus sp.]
MTKTVDARGLSCPQPVIMFLDAVKSAQDTTFEVIVDTEASKENVSRAAESRNCHVKEIREQDAEYHLTIVKNP